VKAVTSPLSTTSSARKTSSVERARRPFVTRRSTQSTTGYNATAKKGATIIQAKTLLT